MQIKSFRAQPVTNPEVLGRPVVGLADWHNQYDHMNPLGTDTGYQGQASRFEPPWGEVMCVVTTNSGAWGLGMGSLAGVTAPLINDYLGPMLSGESIEDRERLWDVMKTLFYNIIRPCLIHNFHI